jgi:phage terminase small subunit
MTRRRKLAVMERLEGFPGKTSQAARTIFEEAGIPGLGEPFIPEHLMDDARGCIELVKQSMPGGIYSALDSYLLAAFGMAWAIHKMAALAISAPDFEAIREMKDTGALVQNQWLAILNKQALMMATLGDRLGLDPKSRALLKLPGAKQQKSQFAGLIGQSGSLPSLSDLPSLRV